MKKRILLFITFLILFIPFDNVFAADVQEHIVTVDKLEIDGSMLEVNGYAFISHRDNYGKSNNKGNLETYLFVYDGNSVPGYVDDGNVSDYNDVVTWVENYVIGNGCSNNSEKCHSFKAENQSNVTTDLYYSRCVGSGCANNRTASVNSNYNFDDGSNCSTLYSYCLYYDVDFHSEIDLLNVVKSFYGKDSFDSDDGVLNFKVVSIITDKNNNIQTARFSDLGIYSGICEIEGNACLNEQVFKTGNNLYDIKISGPSGTVKYDATQSYAIKITDENEYNGNLVVDGKSVLFDNSTSQRTVNYKVLDLKLVEAVKKIDTDGDNVKEEYEFYDYFVKLDSVAINFPYNYDWASASNYMMVPGNYSDYADNKYNTNYVCTSYYLNVHDDNGYNCNSLVKSDGTGYEDYWAYANWVKFNNSFKILSFGINTEKIECSEIKQTDLSYNTSSDIKCNNDATDVDASFYECKELRSSVGQYLTGKMYYKIGTDSSCSSVSGHEYHKIGSNYYLPIDVNANVLIEQIGKFNFSSFTPSTVKAGKGFSIDHLGGSGTNYYNEISWVVADRIKNDNSNEPYIYYEAIKYKVENSECVRDYEFNLYEDVIRNENYVTNANNGKIYYYDATDQFVNGTVETASLAAIDKVLRTSYFSDYDTSEFALKESAVFGAEWNKDNRTITTDGVDDYVNLGLANYDFGNSFSAVVRAKINNFNIGQLEIILGNVQSGGFSLYLTKANEIASMVYIGNDYYRIQSNLTPNPNEWYTFVVTYDGVNYSLYANGNKLQLNNAYTNNYPLLSGKVGISNMPFFLGANPNDTTTTFHNEFSNVTFSDVLIFDRALSASEIYNNYREVPDTNGANLSELVSYYDFSDSDTITTASEIANKIKFNTCDSNSSSTKCAESEKIELSLGWKRNDQIDNKYTRIKRELYSRTYGLTRKASYEFTLPNAYIVLGDITYGGNGVSYKSGDVIYSNSLIYEHESQNLFYAGNKYYVGFKYIYDDNSDATFDFPFNIIHNANPSLVSNMTWTLNGTCGVEVDDGYYKEDCEDGNCDGTDDLKLLYKYRPISLENPFPKATTSTLKNWINWYNDDSNKNRISNTYDNGIKYSVSFYKNDLSGVFSISDIINCGNLNENEGQCSKGYGSLSNFTVDGESNFVTNSETNNGENSEKNFIISEHPKYSYCGLGFFSTTCDNYLIIN